MGKIFWDPVGLEHVPGERTYNTPGDTTFAQKKIECNSMISGDREFLLSLQKVLLNIEYIC